MEWLRIHKNLHDNPKILTAARELGITVPTMIGHLVVLWDWADRFAPSGDISDTPDWMIEQVAMWDGDTDTFFSALVVADLVYLDEGDDRIVLCEWEAIQ
jgi:hypothetical protein